VHCLLKLTEVANIKVGLVPVLSYKMFNDIGQHDCRYIRGIFYFYFCIHIAELPL